MRPSTDQRSAQTLDSHFAWSYHLVLLYLVIYLIEIHTRQPTSLTTSGQRAAISRSLSTGSNRRCSYIVLSSAEFNYEWRVRCVKKIVRTNRSVDFRLKKMPPKVLPCDATRAALSNRHRRPGTSLRFFVGILAWMPQGMPRRLAATSSDRCCGVARWVSRFTLLRRLRGQTLVGRFLSCRTRYRRGQLRPFENDRALWQSRATPGAIRTGFVVSLPHPSSLP